MLAQRRAQEAYISDPMFQAIGAFEAEHGNFNRMSLSGRALWSRTIRPIILKKQQEAPDFFSDETGSATLLATAAFVYGVPDEAALTQEEALALAERALVEALGRTEAEIKFYTHRMDIYYDVTDPEKPRWKFFFRMPNPYDSDEAFGAQVAAYYGQTRPLSYKVELDARTGVVVKAFGVELGDLKTLEDWMLTR